MSYRLPTTSHPLRRYLPDATRAECRAFDREKHRNVTAHRLWRESHGRRGWPAWWWLDPRAGRAVSRAQRRAIGTTDTKASE